MTQNHGAQNFAEAFVEQEDLIIERVEALLEAVEGADDELTPELETSLHRLMGDNDQGMIL